MCFEAKSALRGGIFGPRIEWATVQFATNKFTDQALHIRSSENDASDEIILCFYDHTRPFTEHAENNLAKSATIQLMTWQVHC